MTQKTQSIYGEVTVLNEVRLLPFYGY